MWIKLADGRFINLNAFTFANYDPTHVFIGGHVGGLAPVELSGDDARVVMRILEAAADETRQMEAQSWNRRNAQSYRDAH